LHSSPTKHSFEKENTNIMLRRFHCPPVVVVPKTTSNQHLTMVVCCSLRNSFGTPLTSSSESGWGDPTERSAPIWQLTDGDKPKRVRVGGTPVTRPLGQRSPRQKNEMVGPAFLVFSFAMWRIIKWIGADDVGSGYQ